MEKLTAVSFKGKRVLIRIDFNVPLDDNFKITDNSRILGAIPTIKMVIAGGGKVILISHLGRPKNGPENCFSLKHLVNHLSTVLEVDVAFANNCIGETAETAINNLEEGSVLLLENLRFHSEEKMGDTAFAKQLANLADIYINDAFGTAHRAHASTAVIAQFFPESKYFGLLLEKEISNLEVILENPQKPFTAIIGGAKITGKIDVIMALLDKVDNLIIGGGMAYTFAKAVGGNIGNSLVEEEKNSLAKQLIELAKSKGVNLYLPSDSVNANKFDNNAETNTSEITNIPNGFMGLDIGQESIAKFSEIIERSKTIIWNGPMGVFEMPNFEKGTREIANAICKVTEKGAYSLVGGGDSVAAIKQFGLAKKVSYISTGGGAMLAYLEGKTLPGVDAILS
ncbi:MAG TPA: phosphoglycerate kinase [Flavobacteriales bacterium]|nr:phosphoglycerate kinase [Flavobacteriales bacterium]